MVITRRSMLFGIGAALAAPAIVRAESLMKIVAPRLEVLPFWPMPAPSPVDIMIRRMMEEAQVAIANQMADALFFGSGMVEIKPGGVTHVPYELISIYNSRGFSS